jgi:hypothetical protein
MGQSATIVVKVQTAVLDKFQSVKQTRLRMKNASQKELPMASANSVSPVLAAESRAWSYWFVDGLPHLMAGSLCLLLGVVVVTLSSPRHTRSPLVIAFVASALLVYCVVFLRLRRTLEWLKSRITYPRTGYAAAPYFMETSTAPVDLVMLNLSGAKQKETMTSLLASEDLRWRLWVMLAILVAEPLAGKFISSHVLCVFAGCVAGLLAWIVSRKDPRKSWAVVFGLIFAQIYTLNFLDMLHNHRAGIGYFQAGVGFVLALAGAIALTRYLRRNPVAGA